ncbi:hypothetical protein PTKIN_Ptkin14bG0053700 [Pterospermum kingtungense]
MDEQSDSDTIFEEREEFMVSPTGEHPTTRRKAHFLKPTAFSNNGEVSELPPDCLSPKTHAHDLKHLSEKVMFRGWKHPTQKWKLWVRKMHSKHQSLWKQVGIYEAVMSSIYDMKPHKELVLGLAEKWCLDTNTFVFPWGEATITLEDVMVCGGCSVVGESVLSPLRTKQLVEVEEKLIEARKEAATGNSSVATHKAWIDYFMRNGNDLEHEAFLSLWLSKFVLVNSTSCLSIGKHVFPVAISLARGTRVALAPAVLCSIYKDLSLLKDWFFGSNVVQINELVNLYAPFQLVQVWAWERFPMLRPPPNSISHGEPRVARWHKLKVNVGGDVRLVIDSAGKSFQWRPYAVAVKNWSLTRFYGDDEQYIPIDSHFNEELESFARWLRAGELVGLGSIEKYLPHRVAMQFGMDQDLPGCVARCNGNTEIAWRNYNRAIHDAVFYVPPRLFESNVTKHYSDWWKQSMQAHCDGIMPYVKRPRSPRKIVHVSVKSGDVSRRNFSKEYEDREVESGDLVEDEDMEDQLTISELLRAKRRSENFVMGAKSLSPQGPQCPLSSTKEIETLANMEANMEPGEVNVESCVQDQNDAILENISEGDNIGFTLAVDVQPLSVGESQNLPTIVGGEGDVEMIELEVKRDADVTENEISAGESKGMVADDVKSKPGLKKDGEQGSSTLDLSTLGLDLIDRISRLEKVFSELKEKRFRKKSENHFTGGSSRP